MSNRQLFGEPDRLQQPELFPVSRVTPWTAIRSAWRRHRSRQRIAQLDNHLLRDIGISFAEAEAEANKPFWRA